MSHGDVRYPGDVRVSMASNDAYSPPNGNHSLQRNPYATGSGKADIPLDNRTSLSSSGPRSPGSGIGSSPLGLPSRTSIGSSFIDSTRNLNEKDDLQDGCLILGKDGLNTNKYVTRFRINTHAQRAHLGRDLIKEECCPVCEEENRNSFYGTMFAFIRGESFLLSLHISALLLGVAKEAFEVGKISNDLEIIHSSLETVVAVLQLLIRIFAVRSSRKEIKSTVKCTQHVSGEYSVTGRKLHTIVNTFTAVAVFLILFAIICCTVFIVIDEMTWTLLSNNFVMIVGTVMSNLILLRIEKIKSSITMDQHKAVLYESTLLLQDSIKANDDEKRKAYYKNTKLFLRALLDTNVFAQPEHIELDPKYKEKFDLMANLEMLSYV